MHLLCEIDSLTGGQALLGLTTAPAVLAICSSTVLAKTSAALSDPIMRRFFLPLLAFLATFVATWLVTLGVYIVATSLGWLFDRDGGLAMGMIFIMGPIFGLVLGLVAAIVVSVRLRRRSGAA